jgi:hypothetical protein
MFPSDTDQERIAAVSELNEMIASATSPKFVEQAIAFRESIQEDDVLVQFCTDRSSWRNMAGRSGFAIKRDGVVISWLLTKLN